MAFITYPFTPADNMLVSVTPRLIQPQQVNRSLWAGRTQVVGLPGRQRWQFDCDVRELPKESEVRQWRAFLAACDGSVNTFALPVLPSQQTAAAEPTVTSETSSTELVLSSGAGIVPGMMVSIKQSSTRWRLVTIKTVATDTITFSPPLETSADLVAAIKIQNPFCIVRMREPDISWKDAGTVGIRFECEES